MTHSADPSINVHVLDAHGPRRVRVPARIPARAMDAGRRGDTQGDGQLLRAVRERVEELRRAEVSNPLPPFPSPSLFQCRSRRGRLLDASRFPMRGGGERKDHMLLPLIGPRHSQTNADFRRVHKSRVYANVPHHRPTLQTRCPGTDPAPHGRERRRCRARAAVPAPATRLQGCAGDGSGSAGWYDPVMMVMIDDEEEVGVLVHFTVYENGPFLHIRLTVFLFGGVTWIDDGWCIRAIMG